MKQLRLLLLTTLLLLPATRLWAADWVYQAELCNRGGITVDVATARGGEFRSTGLFTETEVWVIERWIHVRPGQCEEIFSYWYPAVYTGNRRPVHLAFAFTDSTGVWGATRVKPFADCAPSRLQLCVAKNDYKYQVDTDDPAAICKRDPKAFLIPASIECESALISLDPLGYGTPRKFSVALGPSDRAIPLGPQASARGPAPAPAAAAATNPGTADDLIKALRKLSELQQVLNDAIGGPGAPKPPQSDPTNWEVCMLPAVVNRQSWASPPTARTTAFKNALRQFIASHTFGNVSDGKARIRVTETADRFTVDEVRSCSGYSIFNVTKR